MNLVVRPLETDRPPGTTAAIERHVLDELGVADDAVVELSGPRGRLVADVSPRPLEDAGERRIRLDALARASLGVDVGESVTARSVDVRSAEHVDVGLPAAVDPSEALALSRSDALVGRAVVEGQVLAVAAGSDASTSIPVAVLETDPDDPVVVETWTKLTVAAEPSEDADRIGRRALETYPDGRGGSERPPRGLEGSPRGAKTSDARDGAEPSATAFDHGDGDGPGPDVGGGGGRPDVSYEDVGGLADELEAVREVVELPMVAPGAFDDLGVDPPTGVLLYGPPGTGKTLIARAVAGEVDAHFQTLSGPEIVSKYYGESEQQLRSVFETAEANAPAIVFVDEIDAIAPKREDVRGDVERRIVAQLLTLLDGLDDGGRVVVVGTTNRVDDVDPALRRPGRFDREIEVGVPDRAGRNEILRIHAADVSLSDDVDLDAYAERTHGFVGADLENLVREAAMCALGRVRSAASTGDGVSGTDFADAIDGAGSIAVTDADLRTALRGIEPSAMREVFVEVPDVGWDDVGGLEPAKRALREAVQWPLEFPEAFDRVGLDPATGVLLTGPPGTGKTALARAVASEAESNFVSVDGPELIEKYVGESERAIRDVFATARENAPAVLAFDDVDAIAGGRGGDADVGERVVSQLLTELDGLEGLEDVVVLATTNRPELLDDALVRPGRLERRIRVPPPDEAGRREIFEIHTRESPLADDVDLGALAARTEGFVGADVAAVCRDAARAALREYVTARRNGDATTVESIEVTAGHFDAALDDHAAERTAAADRPDTSSTNDR